MENSATLLCVVSRIGCASNVEKDIFPRSPTISVQSNFWNPEKHQVPVPCTSDWNLNVPLTISSAGYRCCWLEANP